MILLGDVLVQPITTEKTVADAGKYYFLVHPKATKPLVKKALEEFYGASVESVNILKNPPKTRVIGRGRIMTKRSEIKKAVVTLKKGATLDFNAFK